MPTRTYVDADVLMAAYQGDHEMWAAANAIIDDPNRSFVCSDYLRLEVLWKPRELGREDEVAFMERFLASCESVPTGPDVTAQALRFSEAYHLKGFDALHASIAASSADELVTGEKPTKPIHRVREVRVHGIRTARDDD